METSETPLPLQARQPCHILGTSKQLVANPHPIPEQKHHPHTNGQVSIAHLELMLQFQEEPAFFVLFVALTPQWFAKCLSCSWYFSVIPNTGSQMGSETLQMLLFKCKNCKCKHCFGKKRHPKPELVTKAPIPSVPLNADVWHTSWFSFFGFMGHQEPSSMNCISSQSVQEFRISMNNLPGESTSWGEQTPQGLTQTHAHGRQK